MVPAVNPGSRVCCRPQGRDGPRRPRTRTTCRRGGRDRRNAKKCRSTTIERTGNTAMRMRVTRRCIPRGPGRLCCLGGHLPSFKNRGSQERAVWLSAVVWRLTDGELFCSLDLAVDEVTCASAASAARPGPVSGEDEVSFPRPEPARKSFVQPPASRQGQSGGGVPGVDVALPVAVEASRGGVGEAERARAEPQIFATGGQQGLDRRRMVRDRPAVAETEADRARASRSRR